jgi:hypothetical protein
MLDEIAEIGYLVEQKEWRKNLEEEVCELLIPHLMDMDGTRTDEYTHSPGHYSGVFKTHLEIFSRGLFSHMIGGDTVWMQFGIFESPEVMQNRAAQEYFEMVRQICEDGMYNDKWYDLVKPAIETAASVGYNVNTVTGEYFSSRIDCLNWHPGDVYFGTDGGGWIDRVAIKIRTTPQALSEMEDVTMPAQYVEAAKKPRSARKETILWAYFKRVNKSIDPKMGWHYKVLTPSGETIHETPLYQFPGAVWIFEGMPRTQYGNSIGLKLYRDMLQSNKIQKLLMQEAEVRVNPPVWMPNFTKDVFMDPGSINYVDNIDGSQFPRRMIDLADMNPASQLKAEIDRLASIHFLSDFFMQLTGSTTRRTAEEVRGMLAESGMQIVSIVDSFERNFCAPNVRQHLSIMYQKGQVPDPPNIIKKYVTPKTKMGIKFIGPLAMARRQLFSMGQDMRMVNEILAPLAGADPTVIDYLDIGKMISRGREFMSGGSNIVRSDAEVAAIRKKREQQQMQQMQMEMAGKAMNATKAPEAGSPAEAVMGGR